LLAASDDHQPWAKKLHIRGQALVGWERVYEMDPKTSDADLLEMADAMGVSLESACTRAVPRQVSALGRESLM